jgi:hypothetical protein
MSNQGQDRQEVGICFFEKRGNHQSRAENNLSGEMIVKPRCEIKVGGRKSY